MSVCAMSCLDWYHIHHIRAPVNRSGSVSFRSYISPPKRVILYFPTGFFSKFVSYISWLRSVCDGRFPSTLVISVPKGIKCLYGIRYLNSADGNQMSDFANELLDINVYYDISPIPLMDVVGPVRSNRRRDDQSVTYRHAVVSSY